MAVNRKLMDYGDSAVTYLSAIPVNLEQAAVSTIQGLQTMSTKRIRSKNQHYVPQFLLRNFAIDGTDRVHVFDKLKSKSFLTSVRNVGAEAGFYDVTGDEKQSLEAFLSRMEASVSHLIGRIVRQECIYGLSSQERVLISLFAAIQVLRVKSARHRLQSFSVGCGTY